MNQRDAIAHLLTTGQRQPFGFYKSETLDDIAALARSVPNARVNSIMESVDRAPPSPNIEDRREYDPTLTPNEIVDLNTPYAWEWALARKRP
jgi:hypothetical protein